MHHTVVEPLKRQLQLVQSLLLNLLHGQAKLGELWLEEVDSGPLSNRPLSPPIDLPNSPAPYWLLIHWVLLSD